MKQYLSDEQVKFQMFKIIFQIVNTISFKGFWARWNFGDENNTQKKLNKDESQIWVKLACIVTYIQIYRNSLILFL